MTIDVEKFTKEIMKVVAQHMIPDPDKMGMGFSAMCNICGSGSISFCPCSKIMRLLENPPEHVIVKSNI